MNGPITAPQTETLLDRNRQRVKLYSEAYPGSIILPIELGAADFLKWHRIVNSDEYAKDERFITFKEWSCRWHIVKGWELEGIEPSTHVDETGEKMPSLTLMNDVIRAIQPLLMGAQRPGNLRMPSGDTTPTTATEPEPEAKTAYVETGAVA